MPSRLVFAALAGLLSLTAAAQPQAVEVPLPTALDPQVETIQAPLASMPTIQTTAEPLVVEILPGAVADPAGVATRLQPSFGRLLPVTELGTPTAVATGVPSRLWPDRNVDRLSYALPADLLPDLYDLVVDVPTAGVLSALSGQDRQRRAVSIVAEYPDRPRVVVIADPSVGDPRPLQDAAGDALNRGEVEEALTFIERSAGNPMNSERWAALARTIQEVNLVKPDFVLITGDLTFAVHPTTLPYEYEDAWRLLDRLEVPAFLTPGNHDLYAVDDYAPGDLSIVDGWDLWPVYFGPLHYSVDIGPDLHLVSINSFDFASVEPFPAQDDFDTLAGGQIRAEQMAWLADDLAAFRARSPGGVVLTFAHHDPSWLQRRHPWKGEGRLESRDLFAARGVGAHFSGHTHEDRVARYFQGDIVETNGRPHVGHPVKQLHRVKRDGSLDESFSQQALGEILRTPEHGPLFVSTTTTASQLAGADWGLGGYWGWRLLTVDPRNDVGGLDPADFGYPATEEFLAARAERPENWTADHARFGLFSYPSFELASTTVAGNDGTAAESIVEITSGLLAPVTVTSRLLVAAGPEQAIAVEGGELLRTRRAGDQVEAWVRGSVPAEGRLRMAARGVDIQPAADEARAAAVAQRGGALEVGLVLSLLFLAGYRTGRRRAIPKQSGKE